MGAQPPVPTEYTDITPPPAFLRWGIWLLVIVFVVLVISIPLGIYGFREWVPPRYQVTYSERFPILQVILPPRPAPNTILPTPVLQQTTIPLNELLGISASTPTDAPTLEPTLPPTMVATPIEVTATPSPAPTSAPLQPSATPPATTASASNTGVIIPASARNFGFRYITQTWNNCGPANVTMSLSYFGWQEEQSYAERYLRGGREDKNVSPAEIVTFVNDQSQVSALYRIGGDLNTLKRLVAAELPVMVELGYAPAGNDWLGHYQTVIGYDDSAQSLTVFDSYIPSDQGLPVSYTDFDRNWQNFSRTFLVYFPPDREAEVMGLLGDLATPEGAYQVALDTARREARENPENGFAWFNLGKAQTRLGNYAEAASAFDQARLIGTHWRMLWYQFEPFEAYFNVGRYDDVLALVEANEATLGNGYVEETYYWAGRVYETQGNVGDAASAYRRALQQNSRYIAARDALERIS
jgi:tetratricopeptide (TPR) repeat protein